MKVEQKIIKCANCGKESEQLVVYSKNNFGNRQHMDGRCDRGEVSEMVQECPHCHYANVDISEKIKDLNKIYNSEKYQNVLNSNVDEKIKNYIKTAIVNEKDNMEYATQFYLYAMWCFEDKKDDENAAKYRCNAYKNLLKIAEEKDSGEIFIQCVDLLRKDKEFESAQKLLTRIKSEFDKVAKEVEKDNKVYYETILQLLNVEQELLNNKDYKDHIIDEF